jgi:hypothetical protein
MKTLIEMFKRGLQGDQSAQGWFQENYSPILLEWLHSHPGKTTACTRYTEEMLVNHVFQCAWNMSEDCQQFEFKTSTAIIRYLRATLHAVILDTVRAVKASSMYVSLEAESERRAEAQNIWEGIVGALSNERECRMAYLLFQCGFKPQDILSASPDEFSDLQEILRLRLKVMRMLSHSPILTVNPVITSW